MLRRILARTSLRRAWSGLPVQQQQCAFATNIKTEYDEHKRCNDIAPIPGSRKYRNRRGLGLHGGQKSGRGTKGQRKRNSTGAGRRGGVFEGGQVPFWKRLPKRGWGRGALNPKLFRDIVDVSLGRIARWVELGRLDPDHLIDMRGLRLSKAVGSFKDGVRLVAGPEDGVRKFQALGLKCDLLLSEADPEATKVVEEAGGTVTLKYFTRRGMLGHVWPERFVLKGKFVPEAGSPPPRLWDQYPDQAGEVLKAKPEMPSYGFADLWTMIQEEEAAQGGGKAGKQQKSKKGKA